MLEYQRWKKSVLLAELGGAETGNSEHDVRDRIFPGRSTQAGGLDRDI